MIAPMPGRSATVDFLYSLYDALVSVSVPPDKARAVVDAMERDMGTTLATKADLDAKFLLLQRDIAGLRGEQGQRIDSTREFLEQRVDATCEALDHRVDAVRDSLDQKIDTVRVSLDQKIDAVRESLEQKIDAVQSGLRLEIAALDQRLSQKMDGLRDLLQKDMELLRSAMTIRLGSIQVISLGLLFAALRLT